eukprot:1164416-Amphidinium_carterae.1
MTGSSNGEGRGLDDCSPFCSVMSLQFSFMSMHKDSVCADLYDTVKDHVVFGSIVVPGWTVTHAHSGGFHSACPLRINSGWHQKQVRD